MIRYIRQKPAGIGTFVYLIERATNGVECCLLHGHLVQSVAAELVEWLRGFGIEIEHRCPRCGFVPQDHENADDEFDSGSRAGTWACRECGCEFDPTTGFEEPEENGDRQKELL